ncbi:MAG: hypothetical protein U5K84_05255 [Alkalibacterium sp.]|nr:hypothetical protein [Alkalibacterium sp.]
MSDYSEKAEKDSLKDAFSTLADRQLRVRERVIKEDELLHES